MPDPSPTHRSLCGEPGQRLNEVDSPLGHREGDRTWDDASARAQRPAPGVVGEKDVGHPDLVPGVRCESYRGESTHHVSRRTVTERPVPLSHSKVNVGPSARSDRSW